MCEDRRVKKAWSLALIALLFVSAVYGWVRWSGVPDVAWGCDQFGHLVQARNIRRAASEGLMPDFSFGSTQGRELIEFMKSTGAPVEQWHEMVAPHAHHYIPRADRVSDQYSPGTGLVLSIFPEGRAVGWLNRTTILLLLALGVAALLVRTKVARSPVTAGWAALGVFQGIHLLIRYDIGNYSLNAVVLPTMAAAFLCAWSWSLFLRGKNSESRLAALGCGVATGFAAFVRIPGILQIPGFMALLDRKTWPYFLAGGFVFGFLPQAWYQHHAAGAWWASTYDTINNSAPVLKAIPHYIRFYLLKGHGAPFFLVPAIAFASYFSFKRWKHWKTLGRAALIAWALPAAYFLTHVPAVLYYLCPAHLSAVGLLCWGVYFEYRSQEPLKGWKERARFAPAIAVLALTLPFAWDFASGARVPMPSPWNESLFSGDRVPAELKDPKIWIWSDVTNGAFWYYADKPAFNIAFGGTPELRRKVFTWVASRGEDQYLIMDGGLSQSIEKEVEEWGGKFELRGEVFGNKYFRMSVPEKARQRPS